MFDKTIVKKLSSVVSNRTDQIDQNPIKDCFKVLIETKIFTIHIHFLEDFLKIKIHQFSYWKNPESTGVESNFRDITLVQTANYLHNHMDGRTM